MKRLTEKEKAQLSDEERSVFFHHSMFKWARKIVFLRRGYQYFIKNKGWIFSLLFVLSIIKSSIWYACFGVNILTYSTLQDLFISFADYFMSIIVTTILIVCFYLFIPQSIDNKCERIIIIIFTIIFFAGLLWIILSLYRMIFSLLILVFTFLLLLSFWISRTYIALFYFIFFYLFGISIILPLEQYLYIEKCNKKIETCRGELKFQEQSAHYDYTSFDYNNTHIETNTNIYYLIGSNSNYYFILDKNVQETLIIPKSECKNIKSHLFRLHNLLFIRK